MSDDGTTQERLRDAKAALARIRQGELPTAAELAAAPRLEFWSVVTDGRFIGLAGVVTGHPNLHHGDYIRTSHLLWIAEDRRSEEHTSELQSLMRISYAVFCLKKKKKHKIYTETHN